MFRPHCLVLTLGLALITSGAVAANDPKAAAVDLMHSYIAAWDRADAQALGMQFLADGDFISPTGFYARGPQGIEAFYKAAFDRGYAGSRGGFTVKSVRKLTNDAVVIDGLWSIDGARTSDGVALAPERGIATAVIVRRGKQWRLTLLREQSSGQVLNVPDPR